MKLLKNDNKYTKNLTINDILPPEYLIKNNPLLININQVKNLVKEDLNNIKFKQLVASNYSLYIVDNDFNNNKEKSIIKMILK